MSSDKNHSEQFKKYLNGEMTPKEANAFERKTLNDPFAQEALDGLETQNVDQAFSDIADLQKQITDQSKKRFSWMRIAAVIALLFVSAFALWFTIDLTENTSELAIQESRDLVDQKDSVKTVKPISKTTEFIAEAEKVDSSIKTFKKDGVKVVEKIELDDKEREEIKEAEIEPIMTLAEAEVSVEEIIEETETDPIETPFEETDDVQIADAAPLAFDVSEINTEKLDSNLITQSLVASDHSEESNPTKKTLSFSKGKMGSGARSVNSYVPTISGKVTDDSGEPLPGVNVIIKGATIGTQTDLDGNYVLPKLANMTLVYSFVGFESQELEVGARTSIDLSLGGATELQEVVVTGYGTTNNATKIYFPANPEVSNRQYKKYLKEMLQYPSDAQINGVEGFVVLELTISSRGKITNIDIKKSLGYGCDEEAIRLIKEGPGWEAAKRDGIDSEGTAKVKVKFKMDR